MNTHKFQDAIIAWVNGEKIQYKQSPVHDWKDFDWCFGENYSPDFNGKTNPDVQWRVKPVKWYRVGLFGDGSVGVAYEEQYEQTMNKHLIRWLTDRVYYE